MHMTAMLSYLIGLCRNISRGLVSVLSSMRSSVSLLISLVAISACQKMSIAYKSVILSSLTSIHTQEFKTVFRNLLGDKQGRLVYIPTAQYAVDTTSSKSKGEQRRRARYDARQKLQLLSRALSIHQSDLLELDNPTMDAQKLSAILNEASVLCVDGGNTFYLQKHMIQTNFWATASQTLQNGCVYVGASAGGIVAGRSIKTAYWKGWDDPGAAGDSFAWTPETLHGGNICNGHSFFMHYDQASHQALVSSKTVELEHPLRTISEAGACVYRPYALPQSTLEETVYKFENESLGGEAVVNQVCTNSHAVDISSTLR